MKKPSCDGCPCVKDGQRRKGPQPFFPEPTRLHANLGVMTSGEKATESARGESFIPNEALISGRPFI
ncbi:hypothetical protein TNCV_3848451 [Trichonephila clavipes]|uniref:Uncharacterized protein n=1 Tax=Trichonephila clavipes TaxID=2585209 RepID=A0A8X6RGY8_TRICX|nr:hypothetical protein TNCV_3848451 [Trichonephila clavipes]